MSADVDTVRTLTDAARKAAGDGDQTTADLLTEAAVVVIVGATVPSVIGGLEDLIAACVRLADRVLEDGPT